MNYSRLLTPQAKRHIAMSIKAAKFEGNDYVCIDSDRIISLFASTLTHEEYKKLDWEVAEDFLFEYTENKFKDFC